MSTPSLPHPQAGATTPDAGTLDPALAAPVTPEPQEDENSQDDADPRSRRARSRRGWVRRLWLPSIHGVWRQPSVVLAISILALWTLIAIFAPWIAPFDPVAQSPQIYSAPSSQHLFGTDELGRDVFSRVLHGARLSLPAAVAIVGAALSIGAFLGLLAGYVGRFVDEGIMRLTDLIFAFPQIILAMAVAAAFGPSTRNAILALIIVSWPTYARVIRSAVLSVRSADYLACSRLLGVGPWRALRKDVVPGAVGPAVVLATLELGNAVLMLAALSFLGLGPRPPAPEWGAMIAGGSRDLSAWWMSVFPGLAILAVVLAFNILGDALRDRLDPRFARRAR